MIEGAPAQGLDVVIRQIGPDPDQTIKHDWILDELKGRFIEIDTRAHSTGNGVAKSNSHAKRKTSFSVFLKA